MLSVLSVADDKQGSGGRLMSLPFSFCEVLFMALSLIQFQTPTDDAFFYGVLKEGITRDQIFKALRSDDVNIDSSHDIIQGFLDTDYTFSDYYDFIKFEDDENVGTLYQVDYYHDIVTVQSINGGLGGLSLSERNDTNTVNTAYTIADYTFSSELFASADFMPVEFLTGVVSPMFEFAANNAVVLCLLASTFITLGVRILRRVVGALGRGR